MNQTIVGFAGKKQAGKSTSYSCIRLWRPEAQDFSFAENLKRMCVDVLGLEEIQAFGTDDDKNTLCPHLLWENFPLPAFIKSDGSVCIKCPEVTDWLESEFDTDRYKPRIGPMTAREVLQYWGTEIFRRAYPKVWADACIRKIKKSQCQLAIITDVRFPNEVEAIQQAGGKVVRLTKVVFPDDTHPSELALDPDRYDWKNFDFIMDNSEMSVDQQCESLYALLRRWDIVKPKKRHKIHV